jgi:hypothetical protein
LGKIITSKPFQVSSIKMGLESIWGSPSGLQIQEAEGKILQISWMNPWTKKESCWGIRGFLGILGSLFNLGIGTQISVP